jgi:hypothetical protein
MKRHHDHRDSEIDIAPWSTPPPPPEGRNARRYYEDLPDGGRWHDVATIYLLGRRRWRCNGCGAMLTTEAQAMAHVVSRQFSRGLAPQTATNRPVPARVDAVPSCAAGSVALVSGAVGGTLVRSDSRPSGIAAPTAYGLPGPVFPRANGGR